MISSERADAVVASFRGQTILVVGDLMLDRYVFGTVDRISPEAPVPVVHVTGERCLPGGAANVARNIQSLGGKAVVAGLVGEDAAGQDLLALLTGSGICTDGVVRHGGRQTTVKTRVVADRQQVVRVDREDPADASGDDEALCDRVRSLAAQANGVILEDYGKGVLTQATVDAARAGTPDGVPIGLDPKDNHALRIPRIAVATPNYREACAAAGLAWPGGARPPAEDETLASVGVVLKDKWQTDLLIVTLGANGMYVVPANQPPSVIPTRAREVFDVSGAGDTVIAVTLLALAVGATHHEAASLANYAAGVVVGKLGAASCTPEALAAAVRQCDDAVGDASG